MNEPPGPPPGPPPPLPPRHQTARQHTPPLGGGSADGTRQPGPRTPAPHAIPQPDTRLRLIQAARQAFARDGFASASVRHITTAADANLGAITYHFGSKQGLYDAVLETVFGSLRERVGAAAAPDGTPPLERIERIARAVFSVLREDPDFPLLVVQQVSRMGELPGPALQTFPFVFNALMQVVAEGQADGSIRAGSPLLMAVSVISQPAYFGVVTRVLLSRLPSQFGGRPEWDEIEAHALHFIRRGLARRKEET